jgi:hypothetical protein
MSDVAIINSIIIFSQEIKLNKKILSLHLYHM